MVLTGEDLKRRVDLYHRETTIRDAVCKIITHVNTEIQTCTCVIYHNRGGKVSATISYQKSSRDKGRQASKDAAFKQLRRVLF